MSASLRLGWFFASVLAVAALALGSCAQRGAIVTGLTIAAAERLAGSAEASARSPLKKFKHVVVLIQENRTVDNLFNGFPGADTVRIGKRFGVRVHLKAVPLQPAGYTLDHGHDGFVADYDNGKMDGFDHALSGSEHTSYVYVRSSDVANYWTLATRFTLADEAFQINMGPSFASHVHLVAAQGGYPYAFSGNPGHKGRQLGPGCFGEEKVDYVDMRTPFPGLHSIGPACLDMPTIFDLLDARHVDWRYYAPDFGIGLEFWSAPDYIKHLAFGHDHAKLLTPETRILDDIARRKLPSVAYVVPHACGSDHPSKSTTDPLAGPLWVAAITNAIGASPYWHDTLVLVTWDDWGGFYDHVPPPILTANNLGFRVPLLIVSAYGANPGVPDHTVRNQASIIRAIESIFGLGSLNQLDAQTDDLRTDFRYGKPTPYGDPLPAEIPPKKC